MDTDQAVDYMRITGRWWELDTLAEVACAVGMVAAQLDCAPRDAATVLRGHAAAHDRHPRQVALDVVHRDLSFSP